MTLLGVSAPFQQVDMPAVDLRRFIGTLIESEGVATVTDLRVSQRGAGANQSVDIAAGEALIKDDHAQGDGFYWAKNDATVNLPVSAAHGTNPRIDRICLRIRDAALGDAASDWAFVTVDGTPTAGATLSNLNGAAAVPSNHLLLANLLMPAADNSVVDAEIDTTIRSVRPALKLSGSGFLRLDCVPTQVEVVSSAAETTIFTFTVPAGLLGTDGVLKFRAHGDYLRNGGDSGTLRIKLGATTLFTMGAFNLTDSATRRQWDLDAAVYNRDSAAAQVIGGTFLGVDNGGIGGVAFVNALNGTATEDTSLAKAFTVTWQHGASDANSSFRIQAAELEIVV